MKKEHILDVMVANNSLAVANNISESISSELEQSWENFLTRRPHLIVKLDYRPDRNQMYELLYMYKWFSTFLYHGSDK